MFVSRRRFLFLALVTSLTALACGSLLPAPQPSPGLVGDASPALSIALARFHLYERLKITELSLALLPEPQAPGRRQKRIARKRRIPVGTLRVQLPGDDTHTDIVLYDARGQMLDSAWLELNTLLVGEPTKALPLRPRMAAILYILGRDFDRALHIVHTTDHNEHKHSQGAAVDIFIDSISPARLRDHIQARFEHVGVGLRVHTHLIHLDLRSHALYWTDFARPGLAGVESLEPLINTPDPGTDPTLVSPHLTEAQLYPLEHPPKASIKINLEEEKKKDRKKGKKKSKKKGKKKTYKVRSGDTVSRIAKKFGVSSQDIIRWNKLGKKATIRKGQKLIIKK